MATSEMRDAMAWRTRDIVVVAVIGVAFGVFFWAFNLAWQALLWLGPTQNLLYAGWLLPAIVAPLIVRKPGAALFGELIAAGLFATLGSTWSVDTIVSGLLQGGGAELVFLVTRYRNWSMPVVAAASLASMAAAFVHDWLIYYPTYDVVALVVLAAFMGISGLIVLPLAARAIVTALRQAGVLEGFPA